MRVRDLPSLAAIPATAVAESQALLPLGGRATDAVAMLDEQRLWERIQRHAGEPFETKTGRSFTYDVPGNYLWVTREGEKINRSLSRTIFMNAAFAMPADGPSASRDRQGSAYTWAILMDQRIRGADW